MESILFIVGPALGHVGRGLVVARAVRNSQPNIRIVFAHPPSPHVDRLVVPEFDTIAIGHDARGDERFADELERVMRTTRPSLICVDMSPTPWLCFVRFPGVPRAYITNFFLTSVIESDTVQARELARHGDEWNRRRSWRGMPELVDAKQLYEADLVLLADPPQLLPGPEPKQNHLCVGTCVWEPQGVLPNEISSSHRLLLVALGSTGRNAPTTASLERMSSSLVCDFTIGVRSEGSGQALGPRHLDLADVPLSPLLDRTILALTQGGAGSTYAALNKRVPVAISPTNRNHELMGEILESAGIGAFTADLEALRAPLLRERVAAMRAACSELLEPADAASGPQAAAAELLRLV